MLQDFMNINRTKYRYFKDNFKIFPIKPIFKYVIPEDKEPKIVGEHLNRDYHNVNISTIKFISMVEKTANSLTAMGVKEGDIITIVNSNTPEAFYMDYALSKIGAIPMYVYPNSTSNYINQTIKETNSKLVFVLGEPSILENVQNAMKELDVKAIVSSPLESFPALFKKVAQKKSNINTNIELKNSISWQEFIKLGKGVSSKENGFKKNSICSMVSTSGTSSEPRKVKDSNENINAVVRNYKKDGIIYSKENSILQTIPLFVGFGKSISHNMLCNNVCSIIIPEMNSKNFVDLLLKYKPGYVMATPAHIEEMLKDDRLYNEDLGFLKIVGTGGDGFDSIEKVTNDFLKAHGAKNQLGNPTYACNGYGSTEVEAIAISNSEVYHKEGTLGKPVGDTIVGIFEPETKEELPVGKEGEIAITGPTVTLGYYNADEETAKIYQKHNDGKIWVHMGDLGYIDEEGFYHYSGRIKNVIARKAFKFSPKEIVDVIIDHPNVLDCVVVGKYSSTEGQVPSAHITLKDYTVMDKTLDEIIEMVNSRVEEFHRPTSYKISEDIVKTRNNKNNFNALKIEDIAMSYPNVLASDIIRLEDKSDEYDLVIYYSGVIDSVLEEDLETYVRNIMEKEKIPKCTIKFKIFGVSYSDANELYKDRKCKSYVKEV